VEPQDALALLGFEPARDVLARAAQELGDLGRDLVGAPRARELPIDGVLAVAPHDLGEQPLLRPEVVVQQPRPLRRSACPRSRGRRRHARRERYRPAGPRLMHMSHGQATSWPSTPEFLRSLVPRGLVGVEQSINTQIRA
jgi:hypothetical protein